MIIIIIIALIVVAVFVAGGVAVIVTVKDSSTLRKIRKEVDGAIHRGEVNRVWLKQDLIRKAGGITYAPKRQEAFELIKLLD